MEDVAKSVRSLRCNCTSVVTDVTDIVQMENLLAHTLSHHGDCHLIINNVGIIQAAGIFNVSMSQWERVLDINLKSVLYGSRVFGEYFLSRPEGHIVNVSSAAALFPMPGMTMYSPTKSAVEAFTLQLRWELAARGIGVTLACPGTVKSKIYETPEAGLPPDTARLVTRMAAKPEGFARKIRKAIQGNRAQVRYGFDVHLYAFMGRLPMSLKDPIGKLMARFIMQKLLEK